jgi:hypothetical protein
VWNKGIGNYTQDTTLASFLFSLTNGDKFTGLNNGNSIYNDASSFRFGGGHDIYIPNYSNVNNCNGQVGHTYRNSNYTHNTAETWKKFSGHSANYLFKTLEY